MNLIVACGLHKEIGKGNDLIWHIKDDMRLFKELTSDKTVVMGRKTLESLPNGKPLKNRNNIIFTRDENYVIDGAYVVHNITELFDVIHKDLKIQDSSTVFVIGGASIYKMLINYCERAYITKIYDTCADADTYFCGLDYRWKKVSDDNIRTENGIEYEFEVYDNMELL